MNNTEKEKYWSLQKFGLLDLLHHTEKNGYLEWLTALSGYLKNTFEDTQIYIWKKHHRKNHFEFQEITENQLSNYAFNQVSLEQILSLMDTSQFAFLLDIEKLAFLNLSKTWLPDLSSKPCYMIPLGTNDSIHFLIFWSISMDDENKQAEFIENCEEIIFRSFENVAKIEQANLAVRILEEKVINLEYAQASIYENANKFMNDHKKLTDSIMYAKKIQQAILPKKADLNRIFDEHFVVYLPKDIVSGDFYWFAKTDYTFLAVIDCTGHGVPGAFMSMIANTLLNEIVNEKRIYDPSQILSLLHFGVKSSLKQDESKNDDGMDICLIRLERDEKFNLHLTYAGAKRPLYFVRDKQLFKIRGSRNSIGGWQNKAFVKFRNHQLALQAEDVLYLTTDGFVDTPNKSRKSFGSTLFKELMIQNAQLPLAEQKIAFEKALYNHQKGTSQRDDITVVGIKV